MDDPWNTNSSSSGDPWATKPDILASSRLAEFDKRPQENQDVGSGSGGDDPWGVNDEDSNADVGVSGGWGSGPGSGLGEMDLPSMRAPELPSWGTESKEEDEGAWGATAVSRTTNEEIPQHYLPDKESDLNNIANDISRPHTPPPPSPYTIALPETPTTPFSTNHSATQTPIHLSPTKPTSSSPTHFPPSSPAFSDDAGGFGTFSSGLPSAFPVMSGFGSGGLGGGGDDDDGGDWGKMDLGEAMEEEMPSWGGGGKSISEDEDDRAGVPTKESGPSLNAWAPPSSHLDPSANSTKASNSNQTQEDEWALARQRAAKRESRAPAELIGRLEEAWRKVAVEVVGFPIADVGGSEKGSKSGGEDDGEEGLTRDMENQRDSLMYELATRPDFLNVAPTPLISTTTYTLYCQTLSQPLNPHTSLLARASQRSFRPQAPTGVSASDWDTNWLARSRLGEGIVEDKPGSLENLNTGNSASTGGAGRSKWSLWGRTPSGGGPLVTSGGGMLEVKAMSPANTGNSNAPPNSVPAKIVPSDSDASISAPSPVSAPSPAGIINTSPAVSRIASPSPSAGSNTNNTQTDSRPKPSDEPSAVGRFFGRFKRSRGTASSPSIDLNNNQDLQLSNDDLGFLSDVVPSISNVPKQQQDRGVADLLSMDSVSPMESYSQTQKVKSLSDVLNDGSGPMTRSSTPSQVRPGSSKPFAGLGVSRPPVNKVLSNMDLLGGMDFNAPALEPVASTSTSNSDFFSTPALLSPATIIPASQAGDETPGWNSNAFGANNHFATTTANAIVGDDDDDDGFGAFTSTSASPAPGMNGVSSTTAGGGTTTTTTTTRSHPPSSGFADFDDFGDFTESSFSSEMGGGSQVEMGTFDFPTPKPSTTTNGIFASAGGGVDHDYGTTTFASGSGSGSGSAKFPSPAVKPDLHLSFVPDNTFDFSSFETGSSSFSGGQQTLSVLSPPSFASSKPMSSSTRATENLLAAAAKNHARWPAPLSPALEVLPPPPPAGGTSSSSSSKGGKGKSDLLNGDGDGDGGMEGMDFLTSFGSVPAPTNAPYLSSSRATAMGGTSTSTSANTNTMGTKNNGLSKADLSFFDGL